MIIFADSSVIGRAYLHDQPDSPELHRIVREGENPVAICRLTDVEFNHIVALAEHVGRITPQRGQELLDQYTDDTAEDGPLSVREVTVTTFARARELARQYPTLRSLDAIQLAACAELADAVRDDTVGLLTRDVRQADVARQMKIAVL